MSSLEQFAGIKFYVLLEKSLETLEMLKKAYGASIRFQRQRMFAFSMAENKTEGTSICVDSGCTLEARHFKIKKAACERKLGGGEQSKRDLKIKRSQLPQKEKSSVVFCRIIRLIHSLLVRISE
ncbi:hypothetical protein TNCV_1811401 [Trichonephila clavipes]|nr:hypothetical protein TNCV_1811401 [Trichonephila clavipes]